ncbi:muconate cycloisomerase [Pantoea sp. Ap-967]|uniref:muconate/chloromuconate family cycloisomerase n=1 Tax=Pantoea sp. Ap-967 TaxID=2608362 RepID=UPI0014240698|nr:muconate/chloromuconate family cycloisomerase [Pantoea sp. Ap-967]NIE78028.1 muconate cycloisomerase [Pantoea sp. Ap-967]
MSSPVVQRVEVLIVDLPTIRPHKLAMRTMKGQTLVLLKLHCSDGVVGIGEATTIGGLSYGAESPESIKTNLEAWFAPLIVGEDATNINRLLKRINQQVRGNTFAKSAVETALLDAQGKRLDISVADLLGGRVREGLECAWTLASGDTVRDIDEAEQMLDLRRHRHFKLKIGANDPLVDIAHVSAIKRALGDRASVRVDVNQAWSEAVAIRASQMLADAGVELIEQPLHRSDRLGMARLSAKSPIPLMADEAIESVADSFALAQMAAAPIFALKIAKTGGPKSVLKTAAIAEAAGIALYGGTMLEGTVGTVASAQAFSTFESLEWHTELFGPLLLTEDVVINPLQYRDFQLILPSGSGLGVHLDEEKLAFFSRK